MPVSIDKKQYVCPFDFDEGLKLMEHSYVGTKMMNQIESLLSKDGAWHKTKIVWAGDYANAIIEGTTENYYDLADTSIEFTKVETKQDCRGFRYIINHSRGLYIDMSKIKKPDDIHPLPLLLNESNGRGGGDYRGPNEDKTGTWARDIISASDTMPNCFKEEIPGFSLIEYR